MLTPEQEHNLKNIEPTQVFVDCCGNNCGPDPIAVNFGTPYADSGPHDCEGCGLQFNPLQQVELREQAIQLLITEGLI